MPEIGSRRRVKYCEHGVNFVRSCQATLPSCQSSRFATVSRVLDATEFVSPIFDTDEPGPPIVNLGETSRNGDPTGWFFRLSKPIKSEPKGLSAATVRHPQYIASNGQPCPLPKRQGAANTCRSSSQVVSQNLPPRTASFGEWRGLLYAQYQPLKRLLSGYHQLPLQLASGTISTQEFLHSLDPFRPVAI